MPEQRQLADVDVLVIGGGLAGLMAAVSAREAGANRVMVIDKCEVGKSGSSVQAKGLAGVGRWSFGEDSRQKHLEDTLAAGCGLNSRPVTRLVIEGVEAAVDRLEAMGMRFDPKEPHHYSVPSAPSAGHRHYRYINLRDGTGKVLLDVLRRKAYEVGVQILNGLQATDLAVEGDRVVGAIAWDFVQGDLAAIPARATIVATGGVGYLFSRTSNPPLSTGDGLWLAFEAGAQLMDLEMVQFYPVNYVYPEALRGKNVGSYGEARLYNAHGDRFMERYDPGNLENTTRDKLSQAIYTEIAEGRGTAHGGVVIDRTGLPPAYYKQFPVEVETTLAGGLDIRTDRGEVSPAAHYLMGGISVDAHCATTVSGLYAAGEVAGGVHGANRLANNSLSDTLVLGFTAGRAAAESACGETRRVHDETLRRAVSRRSRRVLDLLASKSSHSPFSLIASVRAAMWSHVGVVRSGAGLEVGIAQLDGLAHSAARDAGIQRKDPKCNTELTAALDAEAMTGVGSLIARCALRRAETRGAHCRADFPTQDDARWLCNLIVSRGAKMPTITERPVSAGPEQEAVA